MSTTQNAQAKFTMARAQENLYSLLVAQKIAKVDTKRTGTIYNPYTSLPAVSNGSTAATYNVRAYAADADSLRVNRRAVAAEHVDNYDEVSMDFSVMKDRADNFSRTIAQSIDGYVMASVVGNGGFALGDGGTDGSTTPWTSSTSVIDDIINASIEQVDINDGHGKKKFMVVSPREATDLRGFLQNSGFGVADDAIRTGALANTNGYVGTTVSGVDVYQTNSLRNTAVLTFSGVATDTHTFTINGIVFTMMTTLGSDAGNILIGANADASVTNIAALINAPRTTTAQGVALSEEDAAKIERMGLTAVASTAADTVTITANTTLIVAETLTNAAWGAVSRQLVCGAYDSIFLALPDSGMEYVEKDVTGKHGKEIVLSHLYNTTIWTRNKDTVGTVLVN